MHLHSGLDPESKKIQILNQVQDDNKKTSQCKGIPLGNLTSQIFANVYLNELDQFIKHNLKIKYYIRYADDFIILSTEKKFLLPCIKTLKQFLQISLQLRLHPNKINLRKFSWGIDFCGYIVLPYYVIPRTKTKRRIFRKVAEMSINNQSLQSYLGYFSHSKSFKLQQSLKNSYYLKS